MTGGGLISITLSTWQSLSEIVVTKNCGSLELSEAILATEWRELATNKISNEKKTQEPKTESDCIMRTLTKSLDTTMPEA